MAVADNTYSEALSRPPPEKGGIKRDYSLFYIVANGLGIAAWARDPMYARFAAIVLINMVKTNGSSSDKADS
jgi:hypothetical protein